jgi:hypothetical protein
MLSTQEYASHWGVTPKTVRRWIHDRFVEGEQVYPGGPFYIPESELHRFHPSDARREPPQLADLDDKSRARSGFSSRWASKKQPSVSPRKTPRIATRRLKPWAGGRANG